MELFVINRHGEVKPDITEDEEKEKLEKVIRQIERKKQQRIRQREARRAQKLEIDKHETDIEQKAKRVKTKDEKIEPADDSLYKTEETQTKTRQKDLQDYIILGSESVTKKLNAKRVLPHWLTKPTVISANLQDLSLKVSKMVHLDKSLHNALKENGVKYFFPVQAEVIPFLIKSHEIKDIMTPRDVCVSAPTGSGKTLAFVLPVVQSLKGKSVGKIKALAILPTQGLAEQVFKTFKTFADKADLKVGLASGRHTFTNEQKQLIVFNELSGYTSRIDILVSTPGRLVTHLKLTRGFDLRMLDFLIIDEADRVLDNMNDDWLFHLEEHLGKDHSENNMEALSWISLQKPKSPQKLLFSATLTHDPEKLEKLSLFQPKLFRTLVTDIEEDDSEMSIGKYTTPAELTERYILCLKDLKPLILYNFIKIESLSRVLVFTDSVEASHRLKILMQSLCRNKMKIEELSSNLGGKSRDDIVSSFTKGDINVLICTDFLARGIDFPGVECVVSYSAPKHLRTYIHRVGRTARAGEPGLAVTLLLKEQLSSFKSLLTQLKKSVDEITVSEEDLEPYGGRYQKALDKLKETVNAEEKVHKKKLISEKKSLTKSKSTSIESLF